MTILDQPLTLRSSLKEPQLAEVESLADALAATFAQPAAAADPGVVDSRALFRLTYGLFVLSARENDRDNGCIINTVMQVTDTPKRIEIAVNKANLTHDMILRTRQFNVSVLSTDAPLALFQQFGFQSGRSADKFAGLPELRTANGLRYLSANANAVLSAQVVEARDCGTHTVFLAEVTEARTLSAAPSMSYQYYFDHVKPSPKPTDEPKTGWVCKVCGYVYEGETLPPDFVCPLCKHGPEDFERL